MDKEEEAPPDLGLTRVLLTRLKRAGGILPVCDGVEPMPAVPKLVLLGRMLEGPVARIFV